MKSPIRSPSSLETARFYDRVMDGSEKRWILGKSRRYNSMQVAQNSSTKRYFVDVVRAYLEPEDWVLDFGCGPGSFLVTVAPYCNKIVGVDISKNFVSTCVEVIRQSRLSNAEVFHIRPDELPFHRDSFDVIIMVDVIHHLENVEKSIKEAMRVLKPNGRVLIFEPNKLNPLIALMHLWDRNERGLLRLGTLYKYRKIFSPYIIINEGSYNGLVIGPQSKLFRIIADLLNYQALKAVFGWLNPKVFLRGRKR